MSKKRSLKTAVQYYAAPSISRKFSYDKILIIRLLGFVFLWPCPQFSQFSYLFLSGPSGDFFCFSGRKISLYIYFLVNLGRALGTGGPTTRPVGMSSNLGLFFREILIEETKKSVKITVTKVRKISALHSEKWRPRYVLLSFRCFNPQENMLYFFYLSLLGKE